MATQYNHSAIEKKWRENWEEKPINVNDGSRCGSFGKYCIVRQSRRFPRLNGFP